jgi:hypothetical protein
MASLEEKVRALYVEPSEEVTIEDAHIDPETQLMMYRDKAAVKMVLDDAQQADTFQNINQWAAGWAMADIVYQSPSNASAFDGGQPATANVSKYTVSNHLSAIVPKIMEGIFYEDPCFMLRPRPNVSQEVVRTKTAVFSFQLDDMKFEEECEALLDQMGLLGTCIAKWGWEHRTEKRLTYKRKDSTAKITTLSGTTEIDTENSDSWEEVPIDYEVARPWLKFTDIRTVLVATGTRRGDIRKAKWVIYRDFATYEDLDNLRGKEGYMIPDEDVLKEMFAKPLSTNPDNIVMTIPEQMRGYIQHAIPRNYRQSADPLQNGMEILERWDKDKVIVVLCFNGHCILIRNEQNPYRVLPFYSANWRNIPDSFYGQGLGQLIGSEQIVEQSITNMALDQVAYGLQPTAVRKKGFNALTQDTRWELGGIIDVDDDVDKSFKFMTMPPVPSEAFQFLAQAKSDAAATSGSNELVGQGGSLSGARSTGMRSGTGAAGVIAANASRLDGPSSRFIRQVVQPWLYQIDELNNRFLPTKVLRQLIGDEGVNDLNTKKPVDIDHIDYRNAIIDFEVLAGSKLGAKKEMAQFLPLMLQIFNNPSFTQSLTDAGYRWNSFGVFQTFCDAAGFKFSQNFVVPMTPQEKQRAQANSPAALQQQKLAAANQMQLQQFQQEERLEDQKQLGKAGAEVIRQTTEHALNSEEVNGEPGSTGFGSDNQI